MKILAVETSAVAASAAISEDGFVLGEYFTNTRKMHSQTLMPMVDGLLKTCGVGIGDIGLYAVSAGPGSFTGVRIGVCAVKGMAMARETPCAAVSSLEAIAFGASVFEGVVCPLMDARCGQFYNALFESRAGALRRLTPDRAVSAAELKNEIDNSEKKFIFVGDGAQICYNNLKENGRISIAPENIVFQRASSVALLGYEKYLRGETVSADLLAPVYLRPPQAERERLKKQRGERV